MGDIRPDFGTSVERGPVTCHMSCVYLSGEIVLPQKFMRDFICTCFKFFRSLSTKRETERKRMIRDSLMTPEKKNVVIRFELLRRQSK